MKKSFREKFESGETLSAHARKTIRSIENKLGKDIRTIMNENPDIDTLYGLSKLADTGASQTYFGFLINDNNRRFLSTLASFNRCSMAKVINDLIEEKEKQFYQEMYESSQRNRTKFTGK